MKKTNICICSPEITMQLILPLEEYGRKVTTEFRQQQQQKTKKQKNKRRKENTFYA